MLGSRVVCSGVRNDLIDKCLHLQNRSLDGTRAETLDATADQQCLCVDLPVRATSFQDSSSIGLSFLTGQTVVRSSVGDSGRHGQKYSRVHGIENWLIIRINRLQTRRKLIRHRSRLLICKRNGLEEGVVIQIKVLRTRQAR